MLIHRLLLSQRMHEPLARALAARRNRVMTIDLLGDPLGPTDRSIESWRYSVTRHEHANHRYSITAMHN